jgi:TRAP-type C4-dicarboxylate transport system substrate-binding protein
MKRWSVLASLAAAALVAVGSMNPAMAQKKLKVGSVAPPTIPLGVVLEGTLSEVVKKESNGGLELEVHLRGAICGEQKCGEQSRQGLIAIATSSTANFGNFAPTYASFDLPYIFKNLDSANALAGGWFGKAHHDKAIPDSDFKVWSAFAAGGFRQLGNTKRPVHSPADMKGIKMRVTKSPVEYTFIKEVGAVPVPYDWLQTYQGLQTGVIEGQYVQVPWQEVFKMYEVQPYYTEIGGAWGGNVIYMDNKQYMALSADERKALDTGMAAFDKGREGHVRCQAGREGAHGTGHDRVPGRAEGRQGPVGSTTLTAASCGPGRGASAPLFLCSVAIANRGAGGAGYDVMVPGRTSARGAPDTAPVVRMATAPQAVGEHDPVSVPRAVPEDRS